MPEPVTPRPAFARLRRCLPLSAASLYLLLAADVTQGLTRDFDHPLCGALHNAACGSAGTAAAVVTRCRNFRRCSSMVLPPRKTCAGG